MLSVRGTDLSEPAILSSLQAHQNTGDKQLEHMYMYFTVIVFYAEKENKGAV